MYSAPVRAFTVAILFLAGACGGDDPRAPLETSLEVMTVNVRHDVDEWERRFELIADEIVRLDPDLIGLQEIEIAAEQSQALLELIAERGGADYELYEQLKWHPVGVLTGEGIGIMSRYPIVESNVADLGEQGRVTVWTRVDLGDGYEVDMYNTHLESGDVGERPGDEVRTEQAMRTLAFIEETGSAPVAFLTGDLNATDDTDAYNVLIEGQLIDSYPAVHGDATAETGNTSPIVLMEGAEQDPDRRIDYVFSRVHPDEQRAVATPSESIICFENADDAGFYPSDHLGVMTTFDLVIP